MVSELVVVIIMIPFDCCFLDGPVHALDLPIGPRMLRFGQAVFDPMPPAGAVEWVSAMAFRRTIPVLR